MNKLILLLYMVKKTKNRYNKNKNKTRKKYKGGASFDWYQPPSRLERLQDSLTAAYRSIADMSILSMPNPNVSENPYPYCDRLLDKLKYYFMNPPLNPELINEFIPIFKSMDGMDHWDIPLTENLIDRNGKPINYRPNFTEVNGFFIDQERYNINIDTEIGNGSYSTIYKGDINGIPTTFNVPVEPNFVGKPEMYATGLHIKYANEFFTEQYIHSELFCNYRRKIAINQNVVPTALIPSINFIYKYINNTENGRSVIYRGVDRWKYVSGMEPLGGTLHKWLKDNRNHKSFVPNFIYMITSICNLLTILQTGCNFHHRDLHAGNIMYNEIVNPDSGDISYVWYIIDFGMSTLKINGTQIQAIHYPVYEKDDVFDGSRFISNHGHDLRILFLSISRFFKYLGSYEIYFNELNNLIISRLITTKCWSSNNEDPIHFNGYYSAHRVESIETTPQKVLAKIDKITKMLTHRTSKSSKDIAETRRGWKRSSKRRSSKHRTAAKDI